MYIKEIVALYAIIIEDYNDFVLLEMSLKTKSFTVCLVHITLSLSWNLSDFQSSVTFAMFYT